MCDRISTMGTVVALIFVLTTMAMTIGGVQASDDGKYPTNWKGQWTRVVHPEIEVEGAVFQGGFDQTKFWGPAQEAPLTPEYQKVLADSMADQAKGGLGNYPNAQCLPSGMPRMMTFGSHEYVITPETTYILLSTSDHLRRIFTDGRDWPSHPEPTYGGYSIGRWVDESGAGRYDTLVSETRYFKGPRAFDATGLPLAFDNQSIFVERFFIDKSNPNILHDLTNVIDHALTRPWTSDRKFRRVAETVVQWPETWCQEGNANVVIGKENYFRRTDGLLMPTKKNQPPPDLRYFQQ
jgi:hypothetical protein